jgi:hypothetical protein
LRERDAGLIGEIAAGRPVIASAVLAFSTAALAAVGLRDAPASLVAAAQAFLAALAVMVAAPAAIAAAAPKNFWLRAIYAAFLAGLMLAGRRVVIQWDLRLLPPLDAPFALAAAAGLTVALAIAAPLWRDALRYGLIGLSAVVLAAVGGLSIIALESAPSQSPPPGASLALAAGLGAALAIQVSAAFSRWFAEGGDNFTAAAAAARDASAPALFAIAAGVAAAAIAALAAEAPVADVIISSRIAAASIGFAVALPLFMAAGALSLKAQTEETAVAENRRRVRLRPLLGAVRRALPPSSALAASAILLIAAIVAGFEAASFRGYAEPAAIAAAATAAAVAFVSIRTAFIAGILLLASGRIALWLFAVAGAPPPTEAARISATILAGALYLQLLLAWRDRRSHRRKAREVVQLALADSYFATIAASLLAIAAMAAAEAAGIWSEGFEAARLAAALVVIGLLAAPPMMTAVGALSGRN